MSLGAQKSRLASLTQQLSNQWQETKVHWQDTRAAEFEHKYLDDLFAGVGSALTVIDQLDRLVNKIRSDCE